MKKKTKDLLLAWIPRLLGFALGLSIIPLSDFFRPQTCYHNITPGPLFCFVGPTILTAGAMIFIIGIGAFFYLKLAERLEG